MLTSLHIQTDIPMFGNRPVASSKIVGKVYKYPAYLHLQKNSKKVPKKGEIFRLYDLVRLL